MTLRYLSLAKIELDQSYEFYESQKPKLGARFLREVRQGIKRIENQPTAWTPISKRLRRCLLNKFPFGIIYQIRENEILIIAIAHLHRKPNYWKSRT
ncbi:type II toxin-antitoxin system RelE/ParE family toxin [Belliella pelovolcani]|uniref:ParE toxin of type II toxin-antitoxin system, parDE n=1 Tax=Belliella pelovolcani TaxID=529505 RepID=A0A1N7MFD2_9BACT|nr:type II toxin-antitoxin system RelE/ParE family toxin [Belliella pelovolcani]SIS84669.1 ParE toxin of type II toxin-antitoxin system, parDE [Belliella pelovolcani]